MSSFSSLPFEVAQLIYDSLSNADRCTLLCVCKEWCHIFHGLLYQAVTINSRKKFHGFMELIPKVGLHVRELNLRINKLTAGEIELLQCYAPSIESVRLDWRIWTFWHTLDQTEEGIPRLVTPFFQSYGRLTQLTLDTAWFRNVTLIDLLLHVPRLRDLTLLGLRKTITIAFIESIHAVLPSLRQLQLNGLKSAPGTLLENYVPAHNLHAFQLDCFHGSYHPLWMMYFAQKYPNLQHLAFQHMFEDKERQPQRRRKALALFAKHCRHLKSLHWHAVVPPDGRLFQALAAVGTTLDHVSVLQVNDIGQHSNKKKEQEPRGVAWMDVPSLSLSFWTPSLKYCRYLRHLSLQATTVDRSHVDLGVMLDSCKNLESLVLDNWVVASRLRNVARHPLLKFSAQHCLLVDTAMQTVAKECPNLAHLKLFDCTMSHQRIVHLCLPQNVFRSIDIQHLSSTASKRRIKFFGVETHAKRRWYYMTSFKTRQDSQQRIWDEATEMTMLDTHTAEWAEAWCKNPKVRSTKRRSISRRLSREVFHGCVRLECQSVDLLCINKKRVCLE